MNIWNVVQGILNCVVACFNSDLAYIIVGVCVFALLVRLTLKLLTFHKG